MQTQTRLGLAPSSVTDFIACGKLFQGVEGFPPRKKIHNPASNKSLVNNFSSDSCVSVTPLAA